MSSTKTLLLRVLSVLFLAVGVFLIFGAILAIIGTPGSEQFTLADIIGWTFVGGVAVLLGARLWPQ
jgi:hypothetical protein